MALTNWAGNVVFGPEQVVECTSVEQVQETVASTERLRVLGSGHSFNRIADTSGTLVSLAKLPLRVEIADSQVTVSAGARYGDVVARIHEAGFALRNLGSLPHISIAGSVATGTHGSGDRNGTLASEVSALEIVRYDGELVRVTRDDPGFAGSIVSLGAIGVVVGLTLDLVPAFEVRQTVYEGMSLGRLGSELESIFSSAYSVSAFTNWRDGVQVWRKATDDSEVSWPGVVPARGPRNPVPGMPARFATDQLGVPGPWYARLPHFKLEFTPSSGEELQSEFFVARAEAPKAIEALASLGDRIAPLLHVAEVRTMAADDLWLSPSQGSDTVGFHFTWLPQPDAVTEVLRDLEELLLPLGARPHWAKVYTASPEAVQAAYERSGDFAELLARVDPNGKFRNEYVDRLFPR